MIELVNQHPYLSFFAFCVLVDGITTIVKSVLNYKLDKKSNTDYRIEINRGNGEE